jgi:hypothetical protein
MTIDLTVQDPAKVEEFQGLAVAEAAAAELTCSACTRRWPVQAR